MSAESITENIFRDFYGVNTFIEKSAIDKKRFNFESKKGTGKIGFPDFFKEEKDYVIIVEAKAEEKNHNKAIEEVKLYINAIKNNYNVVGIAISGDSKETIKLDYFYCKKDSKIEDLNKKTFLPLNELNKIIENKNINIQIEELNKYRDKLNTYFENEYFQKIHVKNRPLFFSALLLLKNEIRNFLDNYKTVELKEYNVDNFNTNEYNNKYFTDLDDESKIIFFNSNLLKEFTKKIGTKITNNFKLEVINTFSFLKSIKIVEVVKYNLPNKKGKYEHKIVKTQWEIYEIFLNEFINKFKDINNIQLQCDIVGSFYIEFLKYSSKQQGGDIVLTPDHIKQFMCELLEINHNDVVLDTCTGTGGFLIKSFHLMLNSLNKKGLLNEREKEKIRQNNLIGVELEAEMYCTAFVNMMLNGDGKTHLFRGDSLQDIENIFEKDIIKMKPNKGIINPPYNDNQAITHIERLLNLLSLDENGKQRNSIACIICPSNT